MRIIEENMALIGLWIIEFALFLFALLSLNVDGIIQIGVGVFGIGFIAFGIFNIFCMVDNERGIINKSKKPLLFTILYIIQLAVFIFAIKPVFHGIAMGFYQNPFFLESLIISLIATISIWAILKITKGRSIGFWSLVTFVVCFLVFVILFASLSAYSDCYLAENLDINEIDELPGMDMDYLRITPMKVADRYASDACQYPRHTPLNPSDITMINGTPHWAYLLVPDGLVNVFNIKPIGAVFVDMTTIDKDLEVIEQEFEIAPALALTDDIYWKIHELNYWADCERTLVVLHENEIYLAIPYIEYDLQFTFPMLYRTPKWGGVFLVDSDGKIEELSPREAIEHPVLVGQKIFPEKLVLTYINSQRFWKAENGDYIGAMINTWLHHEDELDITDVSGQGNSQPFLINTQEGLKWFVSCEPYGSSHGIYRIYLLDARTGLIEMKQFSEDEIGPVKACNYARTDNPLVDWSRFQVVEPIPVTPNGELYWEVRIVPTDGSGISYTSFVNPKTGKVTECKTDEEIIQFMYGQISTNETNETEITGVITDIDTFTQDGNTRWVYEVDNTSYVIRAEDYNLYMLSIIVNIEIGDTIAFNFVNDNIIIEIARTDR